MAPIVSSPYEEELTCSVCLDIFTDPHILVECLHTYCLKCVKDIEKNGWVQCPECRQYSTLKYVQQDIKTQRFVNIHNQELRKAVDSRCNATITQLGEEIKNIDETVQKIKEKEERAQKMVTDTNDVTLAELHCNRSFLEQQKMELQSKLALLQDVVHDSDFNLQVASDVNGAVQYDMTQIKEKIKDIKTNMKSNVQVMQDVRGHVDIVCIDTSSVSEELNLPVPPHSNGQPTAQPLPVAMEKLLPFSPKRISTIDNDFWVIGEDCISVYNKVTGEQVKTVQHPRLQNVKSIVVSDRGHVIVACMEGHGLHLLKKDGRYLTQLARGSFSDVATYKGDIYALESNESKLLLFTYMESGFTSQEKLIKVHQYHITDTNIDRFAFLPSGDIIAVTLVRRVHIAIYRRGITSANVFQQTRNLLVPYSSLNVHLCDVDDSGNAIVADTEKNQLMLCSLEGQWKEFNFCVPLRSPIDAVVDEDKKLCVLSELGKISIYHAL